MRKYISYLIKLRLPIIITITVITLALFICSNNITSYVRLGLVDNDMVLIPREGIFNVYSIFTMVLVFIIPIIEFSFKMDKISINQAYSFPILRKNLYLSRYIVGIIEIIVPLVVSYMTSAILIVCSDNLYDVKYLFIFFPYLLVSAILMYSYLAFFYIQANTVIDGIALMIISVLSWLFIGTFIIEAIYKWNPDISSIHNFITEVESLSLFSILFYGNNIFNDLIIHNELSINTWQTIIVITYSIASIVSIILMFVFSKRFKSEDVNTNTNSWFGYKVLLPLLAIGLTGTLAWLDFLGLLIGESVLYLGYVLKHKSFDINTNFFECALGVLLFIAIVIVF